MSSSAAATPPSANAAAIDPVTAAVDAADIMIEDSPTAAAIPQAQEQQHQQQQQEDQQPEQPPQPLPSVADFEPPLACVRRILKNTLPSSTNVGKDASAAFARAAGIFIIYLTACANDFAREHKRQTITANDVLAAVKVSA